LAAKLYQVEIWARDEFVRKSSFETVVARVERGFVDLKTEISNRLDKMADKTDHIDRGDEARAKHPLPAARFQRWPPQDPGGRGDRTGAVMPRRDHP